MGDILRRRLGAVVLAVVVVVFLSASGVANFVTDLWWFDAVGFRDVFTKILSTRVLLGVVAGLFVGALTAANLQVARRLRPFFIPSTPEQAAMERYRQMADPVLPWLIGGISGLMALTSGATISASWESWLLFRNGGDFGVVDPQFQRDVGFYVFDLPFLQVAQAWLFGSLLFITFITVMAHYLLGGIRPDAPDDKVLPNVKVHLSILLAALLAVQGWGYYLNRFLLNFSPRGQVTGASYTDINAELPALNMLLIVTIVAIGLTIYNVRRRGFLLPGAAISLLVLANVLLSGAFPAIIQRLQVEPDELNKEREYIGYNLDFTTEAYGLDEDNVSVRGFEVTNDLEPADLDAESVTFENIRLWDPGILETTYVSLQSLRPYYSFNDVDVDRYEINGELRQVMLSARELQQDGLPIQARTWQIDKLTYTHGLGVVASQVNIANAEGQPVNLAQGVPPAGAEALRTDDVRGGIYYGEQVPGKAGNPDYSVVNTEQAELNYESDTQEQVFTRYAGKGGVEIGGPGSRLAYALRFSDPNLVLSGLVNPDSRILYHRDILDRVEMVAPYLALDDDPYPVVLDTPDGDGSLLWVVDAYTTSNNYPYSQRVRSAGLSRDLNYIRNSVKVTVDAYDGTVTLYVLDETDPVLGAWRSAFPDSFTPVSDAPDGLQEHFRYPEAMFKIQSSVFLEYHITDVDAFYNKADVWALPFDAAAIQNGAPPQTLLDPYYLLMRLPGEQEEEFVLIQPYLARSKPNMVAWLAARSDPEHYGELFAVRFQQSGANAAADDGSDEGAVDDLLPGELDVSDAQAEQQILGLKQAQARIEQTDAIQTFIQLNESDTTDVVRGNLQVIPVGQSILYVEPLFIDSSQERIPELKKVVVIEGSKVAFENTLAEALRALVDAPDLPVPGDDGEVDPDDVDATVEDLLARGLQAFVDADAALRDGDLAGYQRLTERGRALVERAATAQGIEVPTEEPSPEPSATDEPAATDEDSPTDDPSDA